MKFIEKYRNEKIEILQWLESLHQELEPGHFRFSNKGNLMKLDGNTGLGVSTFALKILYQIGAIEHWRQAEFQEWKEFIKSFQTKSGLFVDEYAREQAFKSSIVGYLTRLRIGDAVRQNERFVRAETRQAISSLLMVGDKSATSVKMLHNTPNAFASWLEKLPWHNPWGAASHASHAICFYWYNGNTFNKPANWQDFILEGFRFIDTIRQKDGSWYRGNISDQIKINSAMKILTAYLWCSRVIEKPDLLIDLALDTNSWGDGCSVQNNLFVLQQASTFCLHRQGEIRKRASDILDAIDHYHRSDGGYSFGLNRAQTSYYGYPVSVGLCEGDLHGTMMFTWVIATCLGLLNIADEVGWRPQKP